MCVRVCVRAFVRVSERERERVRKSEARLSITVERKQLLSFQHTQEAVSFVSGQNIHAHFSVLLGSDFHLIFDRKVMVSQS